MKDEGGGEERRRGGEEERRKRRRFPVHYSGLWCVGVCDPTSVLSPLPRTEEDETAAESALEFQTMKMSNAK
jgi:hypothetical protein